LEQSPHSHRSKELYSGASVPFKYKGANQTDLITDGAMTNTSNWTEETGWAVTGGVCVGTNVGDAERMYQSISGLTIGKSYTISAECTAYTDGSVGFYVSDISTAASGGVGEKSSTGVFSYTFIADAASGNIGLISMTAGSDLTVDNIKLVPIGAVAEYDGSGIGASRWDDKSGNELHGTVTGATVENAPADADSGLTYEEGTWTPEFRGSSGSVGSANTTGTGTYTKIGRFVSLRVQMGITDKGSWGTNARIYGLPFTPGSQDSNYGNTINVGYVSNVTFTDTLKGYGYPDNAYIRLMHDLSTNLPVTNITTTAWISFTADYEV